MAHIAQQNVSVMFLPQFDVLCDPLHYTQIAKWNLFVSNDKKIAKFSQTGQYRSAYSGCREHFEDLQQDLAIIGQIAGLVSTLRRSYQVRFVFALLEKRYSLQAV